MRIVGAVTQGSGAINEDGFGSVERDGVVSAAWVFDGVTGINDRNILGEGTDAAWLVARAGSRLADLAARDLPLPDILDRLVEGLGADWRAAGVAVPADYDPPAACLVLVKRYADGWKALRLGDSCLLSREAKGTLTTALPESAFDHWLAAAAKKRRDAGMLDIKTLLAEFRPQLMASRARRNVPGGYGILEADAAAAKFGEFIGLGFPRALLICTDGFYRAVDHYGMFSDSGLIDASLEDGVEIVLAKMRAVEMDDPLCQKFPRFKPADDATAVMLGGHDEPR
jgi:hypothetical protein